MFSFRSRHATWGKGKNADRENRVRHSQRAANNRVEDVDQPMEVLAGCAKSVVHVPRTGRAIRGLDGKPFRSLLFSPRILVLFVVVFLPHLVLSGLFFVFAESVQADQIVPDRRCDGGPAAGVRTAVCAGDVCL